MNTVPDILQWPAGMAQTHFTKKSNLIVSGCSFTACGKLPGVATSWPGILMDRCGIKQTIDYSFAGAGNEYIADSILYHVDRMSDQEIESSLVIVMWTGINRFETKVKQLPQNRQGPMLDEYFYHRVDDPIKTSSDQQLKQMGARQSADKIFQVYDCLTSKNISFIFSFYVNLLYPPYIPKRDLTHEFDNHVDPETLTRLRNLPIVPTKPMDFMFEHGFCNDQLADDGFHPNYLGTLSWVDNVLLPGLVQRQLISRF
jgi:hypothetical protein